jgi:hypothetical protein
MRQAPLGRPALTDQLIDDVRKLVTLGVPPVAAAASFDVDAKVHDEWMTDGVRSTRGKQRQRRYFMAVHRGLAACEAQLVSRIRTAANDNWQAAAWLAERRFPERWTKQSMNAEKAPETPAVKSEWAELDGTGVTPIRAPRSR